MRIRILVFLSALSFCVLGLGAGLAAAQQDTGSTARRVIIFVWDGLRADDVTPENMPNYFALTRFGVVFSDHHAVYPTFTMMNSASIATGTYPGVHGFYGNVVYAPGARGKNAKGVDIDFFAPAFIEDFGVVEAVRESYQGKLTLVSTMLQAAQAKGLTTAAIGKFGAAFIQDYDNGRAAIVKSVWATARSGLVYSCHECARACGRCPHLAPGVAYLPASAGRRHR